MSGSVKPIKSYQKGGMVTKPRQMSAAEFSRNMMEDPRKPGAMMRNARREIENAPKYTEKERAAMREAEGAAMTKKTQEGYKKFYGKK
jgi:hypothetical protein